MMGQFPDRRSSTRRPRRNARRGRSGGSRWPSRASSSRTVVSRRSTLFGDPNVHFEPDRTAIFDTKTALNGKLGLYWGCQDIDPSLSGDGRCGHGPPGPALLPVHAELQDADPRSRVLSGVLLLDAWTGSGSTRS